MDACPLVCRLTPLRNGQRRERLKRACGGGVRRPRHSSHPHVGLYAGGPPTHAHDAIPTTSSAQSHKRLKRAGIAEIDSQTKGAYPEARVFRFIQQSELCGNCKLERPVSGKTRNVTRFFWLDI
eukprot:scaffold814_cov398-Prasinococcus_capsulatus_cf.AAC.4